MFNPWSHHTKDLKMVLDASLLNTQHYKVWIKSKVEQSREKNSALPCTLLHILLLHPVVKAWLQSFLFHILPPHPVVFVGFFFFLLASWIWIILKQTNLTPTGLESNGNERVLPTLQISRTGASPSDVVYPLCWGIQSFPRTGQSH